MKMRKNIIKSIALFSFLLLSSIALPSFVVAADTSEAIVIDRFPKEELFLVNNTKPGDYAYRPLLLQNNHDVDVLYTMQLRNDGEPKLFNELMLEVTILDEVIFNGMLKDFEGLIDQPLDAQTEETIDFTLKFPEELGNEYQGLAAEFVLVFHAKAASGMGLVEGVRGSGTKQVVQGGTLPGTATNMFTFLLIGGILILIGGMVNYLHGKKAQVKI